MTRFKNFNAAESIDDRSVEKKVRVTDVGAVKVHGTRSCSSTPLRVDYVC